MLIPVGILVLALVLRSWLLTTDLYFDEAWYFFLARTLGSGQLVMPVEVAGPQVPFWHFLARPLTYLVFWPWAQLGLLACRLVNVGLGCLLVAAVMRVCLVAGVSRPLAWFAGLTCAVNPALVLWSTYVFPDTLGALLVVLGLWAFLVARPGPCAVLLGLATLAKEVYLASLIAAFLSSFRGARPTRLTAYVVLAGVPYALLFAYVFGYRGMRLQGWAGAPPLNLDFLRCSGLDPVSGLLVGGLLLTPHWRLALWGLTYPLFLVIREVLGSAPGVQLWYAVPGAALMAVARVRALQELGRRPLLVGLLAGLTLWSGLTFHWADLPRATLITHDLRDVTEEVRKVRPQSLLLVGCDWQLPAYPFGEFVPAIMATHWKSGEVHSMLARADYVLVHLGPGPRRWMPFESLVELVYVNPRYQLYRVKARS